MTMRMGRKRVAWMAVATLAIAAPAFAQIGSLGKKLVQAKQTYRRHALHRRRKSTISASRSA